MTQKERYFGFIGLTHKVGLCIMLKMQRKVRALDSIKTRAETRGWTWWNSLGIGWSQGFSPNCHLFVLTQNIFNSLLQGFNLHGSLKQTFHDS